MPDKGKGRGHKPSTVGASSFFLNESNPSLGDVVSFTVNADFDEPYVKIEARQNGGLVYSQTKGQFPGFYDPDHNFTLGPTPNWQAGEADATASLLRYDGSDLVEVESFDFHVAA